MRRTGDVWVALALSAFATVACSDPHGGTLPSPSVSAPTTSPTSGPPTPTNGDPAGAAVNYYSTLQRAIRAPASGAMQLSQLIDSRCECHQVVDLLDRLARQDHRLEFTVQTGPPRVARVGPAESTVFIHVDQSAGRELAADGSVVRTLPASRGEYVLTLDKRGSRWLVAQISRAE